MAAFYDPVVRTAFRDSCDMRDVQTLVTRASERRSRERGADATGADSPVELTSEATAAA